VKRAVATERNGRSCYPRTARERRPSAVTVRPHALPDYRRGRK
jgi:hypothetical protein